MSTGRDDTLRLTRQDVAQRAGIHLATVDKWGKKGVLTRHGAKGHTFYDAAELERVLATRQQPPQASSAQTALPWATEAPEAKQPTAKQPAPAASDPGELTLLRQMLASLQRERDILQKEVDAAYDRERVYLRMLEHVYQPGLQAASAPTLSQRCLEYLQQERTAKTIKDIQRGIGASRSPGRALRYLADNGLIMKVGLATYQAFPAPSELLANPAAGPPPKTVRPQTRQDRILAYLRREARPRLAIQIKEFLQLRETPYDDLARLRKKGVVRQIRPGLWEAVYPHVKER